MDVLKAQWANISSQAEAPENVGELAAAEDEAAATEVTEEERQNLEALIELAKRRLAGSCTKVKWTVSQFFTAGHFAVSTLHLHQWKSANQWVGGMQIRMEGILAKHTVGALHCVDLARASCVS